MIRRVFFNPESAVSATVLYVAATVALTWPLAAGLTHDVPADLGDPLLNCWILGWGADHILRFLGGNLDGLRGFWNANIFYPAPLALAYSEHLIALVAQILPVYAATGNLVLCYNLLFLSTFVLSGLGAYLLVRDLSGSARAALAAGLFYAFAPYRYGQFSHLQVLSSQWMPFVLFGLHRYLARRRPAALAGAAAALVMQNLSCGYYLIFFSPFVVVFALFEINRSARWRDVRMWRDLMAAAAVVALCTWPFVTPYLDLREAGNPPRPIEEVASYSADVYSYLTTNGLVRLYRDWLRIYPKPEGELFPGLTVLLLAIVSLGLGLRRAWIRSAGTPDAGRSRVLRVLTIIIAINVALVAAILLTGGYSMSVGPLVLGARNVWRLVRTILVATVAALVLSPRARRLAGEAVRSPSALCAAAFTATFWLSLGPQPQTLGRFVVGSAAYWYLYRYVPGFDGLRVPSRLAMIGVLFLAVLGGLALARIERRRRGRLAIAVISAVFLLEGFAAPVPMNVTFAYEDLEALPPTVHTGRGVPAVYRALRRLDPQAVLIELPFGVDGYEVRYMFYSTVHWHRLVNGYSGGFPDAYSRTRAALLHLRTDPDAAWNVVARSGATHAILHTAAYSRRRSAGVARWLQRHGARLRARIGKDLVFELPPSHPVRPQL